MEIRFKKINVRAEPPSRGTEDSAGYDLRAVTDSPVRILPGETAMLHTGIAVEIPKGIFGAVFARSGLATKRGLRPANAVGVIDSDYRNEIMVALHNDSNDEQVIYDGDRIAQFVFLPFVAFDFAESQELSDTGRGLGGFGSTGVS